MKKFREKYDYFESKIIGNDTSEMNFNETRRFRNPQSTHEIYFDYMMMNSKILDLMLQTIYMARHKMKSLENEPYFNTKDVSYRVGYLHSQLRMYWKKLAAIYTIMSKRL